MQESGRAVGQIILRNIFYELAVGCLGTWVSGTPTMASTISALCAYINSVHTGLYWTLLSSQVPSILVYVEWGLPLSHFIKAIDTDY